MQIKIKDNQSKNKWKTSKINTRDK